MRRLSRRFASASMVPVAAPPGVSRRPVRWPTLALAAVGLLAMVAGPLFAQEREFVDRRRQALVVPLQTPPGLFLAYCAPCHGDDATGGGRFWVSELTPAPADLTTLGADLAYVLETIRNGSQSHGKSNLCPPWVLTLPDADVQRLALYVLALDPTNLVPEEPAAEAAPIRRAQPFPWLLLFVLVAEGVIIWFLLRRRRRVTHGIP